MPEQEDGEHHCARIVKMIKEHDDRMTNDSNHTKFICSINSDQYKEIIGSYDVERL